MPTSTPAHTDPCPCTRVLLPAPHIHSADASVHTCTPTCPHIYSANASMHTRAPTCPHIHSADVSMHMCAPARQHTNFADVSLHTRAPACPHIHSADASLHTRAPACRHIHSADASLLTCMCVHMFTPHVSTRVCDHRLACSCGHRQTLACRPAPWRAGVRSAGSVPCFSHCVTPWKSSWVLLAGPGAAGCGLPLEASAVRPCDRPA